MSNTPIATTALAMLLLIAVIFDLRSRRIPNALTLGGVVLGIVVSGIVGGTTGLVSSILGALIAAAIGWTFWSTGMIGGADHKLLIAVGAFVGRDAILPTLAAIAIAGGAQALIALTIARVRLRDPVPWRALLKTVRLPYSVAIAIGTLVFSGLQLAAGS